MYTSKTNGLIIQLKWKQIRTRAKDNITLSFMSYWNCITEIKAVHISTKTEERVRYSSCGVIKRRDMNNKVTLYYSKYSSICSRALVNYKDSLLVPMAKITWRKILWNKYRSRFSTWNSNRFVPVYFIILIQIKTTVMEDLISGLHFVHKVFIYQHATKMKQIENWIC